VKYRDLNFLLIGILITLLIFGFGIPLLPRFNASISVSASQAELLTALGTILAAIVALVLGLWGKTLNQLFYKSDMQLIDTHHNRQTSRGGSIQGHTRLKFLNDGGSVAENVMVYVESIKDNGIIRQDFLPVPLSWTHDGRYWRNFAPHEIWYLDLCRKNDISDRNKPVLVLASGQQVPIYEDIEEGKTTLVVKLSQKSGQIRNYKINLLWSFGDNYVKVTGYKEI